jgi:hypothetical protein
MDFDYLTPLLNMPRFEQIREVRAGFRFSIELLQD